MFFLITGASGAGKSTVRRYMEPALGDHVRCVELMDIVGIPEHIDENWRHESVEQVVQYALKLRDDGYHLVLASDPVPPGELLAVPSATLLDGIAACFLDVDPDTQTARLTARGDDPALLHRHIAFTEWMRNHVRDPQHRPDVITSNGWELMQWQRWTGWSTGDPRWRFTEIDTSQLSPEAVAEQAIDWVRQALIGSSVPVLRGRWWEG